MSRFFIGIVSVSVILCIALAVCFLTVPKDDEDHQASPVYGITDHEKLTYEQRYLTERHPEYFGLNYANGLDVYVCQFAAGNYYFYLSEHSASLDLYSMRGCDAASMRLILDTYDVTKEDVTVIPFQHMFSSHIGSYNIVPSEGSLEEARAEYKKMILDMLFGDEPLTPPFYDTLEFDVDGDGILEYCILQFGLTTDRFSFAFSATAGTLLQREQKYYTVIYSDWYKLSFFKCADGVVRVLGVDEKDAEHIFDISIIDGNVQLTENKDIIIKSRPSA